MLFPKQIHTWLLLFLVSNLLVSALVIDVLVNSLGAVVKLGKVHYYTVAKPYMTVKPTRLQGIPPGFTSATSIRAQHSPITKAFLEAQFTLFAKFDDIWNKKFLESMFVSYDGPATAYFEDDAERWLESLGLKVLYISKTIRLPVLAGLRVLEIPSGPPAGPYFTKASAEPLPESSDPTVTPKPTSIDVHDVYRLHKDDYDAFLFGALPDPEGGWMPTNITLVENGPQYIPIPSRMALLAAGLPLSGMRFALKDIFDVRGLPTGAGSLAYERTWPMPKSTAPSVERLLALGATLVGKTRTSQFAHGAQPWEFADVPYSWNPRADGHLTAAASSSGSACAIAGYDWLDFAVGSDTRGSVRKPAALVGAFGLRPTHGSIDLTGVVPLSEEMDTAGFFSRDPKLFSEIGRRWFSESPVRHKRTTIRFPRQLLYPTDHFPVANPDAQVLYDQFVDALKKHLKISKVHVNFTEELLPYFPNGNFIDFQRASNTLAEYRSWNSVGKPLVERHNLLFGFDPQFDPRPREVFERAKHITDSEFEEAVAIRRQFSHSVAENLIKSDIKSCSDSIFMYDAGTGGHPSYRGEDFNAMAGAKQFALVSPGGDAKPSEYFTYVGSMAGLPEVTVPIGQVGFYSQISKEWEMLSVAVQLVAHPGCDDALLDIVKKLADVGVVKTVHVGKQAF